MTQTKEVKLKQTNRELIKVALKANQPILIRGLRGSGKSQTIKSVCEEEGYTVITRNLNGAESYEVVSGLPRQEGNSFNYLIPLWWKDVEQMVKSGKKIVLFFDEINHALPEVLNGLHGVLDPERRIAGLELPEVRIVAAGNMAEENESLTEMPLPLLERFAIKIEDFQNDEAEEYLENKYPEMKGIVQIAFNGEKPNPRRIEKMLICIKAGLTDKNILSDLTDYNTGSLIYEEIKKGNYDFEMVNESNNASKKRKLVNELKQLDEIDLIDILNKVTR